MISLCILVRNTPFISKLIELFKCTIPTGIEYEICIGDNSSIEGLSNYYKEIADEYIYISHKQVFKMGIPFCHNIIASIANSYNIFYIDSDEYPIWINPNIEKIYAKYIVPSCLRVDFCTFNEISIWNKKLATNPSFDSLNELLKTKKVTMQDRLYNSRYAKFEGVCHSIFWVEPDERSQDIAAVLLHNSDVRSKGQANPIIYEQYARQNRNRYLSSSDKVLEWGKGHKHEYNDWKEFKAKARQK